MSNAVTETKTYTFKEAAKLSGLPGSTLRYYETIGIIEPIQRDESSKHRVYTDDDINLIVGIACLNATGMTLTEMRTYLDNVDLGRGAADQQIELLKTQAAKMVEEEQNLKLRQKYVEAKVRYWQSVRANNDERANKVGEEARAIAKEIQAFKE